MKLRSYLILLTVGSILPVLIFAGAIIHQSYHRERENIAAGLIDRTRAISAALDREFLVSIQGLKVLGASTNLANGDLAKFYGDMQSALALYGRGWQNLTLTDPSGQQLINLRRPFGSPLPATGNPEAIERVHRTKEAVIGNLSPGPVTGALGIVVHVPVLEAGEVQYLLNAIFYPAPLVDLLMEQKLPSQWIATIIDSNPSVVARTRDAEKFVAKPAAPALAAQARQNREAAWRGISLDGMPVVTAHYRSSFSGWTVALSIPAVEVDAPVRKSLMITGAGGLILLLLALFFARTLGRRIADPISALSGAAKKLGEGETPAAPRSPILEIDQVAHALENAGRKRGETEAALGHSEASLAAAEARARLGSWELDLSAQTGWWSAEMFRLFERDPANGVPCVEEFLKTVHPDDRARIEEANARVIQSGEDSTVEFRVSLRPGNERHFSAIIGALKDTDGRVRRLAGTVQDITERKAAEVRIRDLNRVYAVLSDINQAIVRIRDPQALLATACRIAVEKGEFRLAWIGELDRATGKIEPRALAGVNDRYVEELNIVADGSSQFKGPTASAVRSGNHVICNDIESDPRMAPWREEALRRGYRSSAALPLTIGEEVFGTFNLYSGERGFFNAAELALLDELAADIGFALESHRREQERIRAERSLRESEERFRQLAENIEEVFWLTTPDKSQMIYVSPAYEKIWGGSCQSLYDSPEDWFNAIHPDDRARVIDAALRQPSGTYDEEYRVVRPDGAIRWIRDRAFPVRNREGKVYRIAGIAEDITDSKVAEETLRSVHEELEKRIHERTRDLQEANLKLRDLDRLKSEFLANMSHELRTPLNAIIGFSQLMHDGKAGGPPSPEQKEYLADVLSSGKHLLQLINDVLDMSKIEAGRMEILTTTFRLDEVIIEVVQNVSPAMAVKGLKLIREIPADLPPLTTDRRKLLQILLNLASNAVKFTDKGEIGLRCETAGDRMRLSVWDTGIGIKPEEIDLLFQPFSQLDSSLRKRHEGTGLGLYLSKKLAALLDSDLTVVSEYGKGSTLTLTIPLVVQQSEQMA